MVIPMMTVQMGCGRMQKVGYSHYASVDSKCWTRDMLCAFDVDTDYDSTFFTPGNYDVVVSVRHNSCYPYSTLRLAMETASLESAPHADTITLRLAADDGAWLGRKTGPLYIVSDTVMRNVWIGRSWEATLTHAAAADTLAGINDLGIILLKR